MSEGLIHSMTPTTPLDPGERAIHSFHPDRAAYRRDHAWLAAGAMALGMGILWAIGNPHVWTGAVGGLAAIAVRGFYVASDELKARWDLTDRRLLGPQTRVVRLSEIRPTAPVSKRGYVPPQECKRTGCRTPKTHACPARSPWRPFW